MELAMMKGVFAQKKGHGSVLRKGYWPIVEKP
jgi:hypothetical protein